MASVISEFRTVSEVSGDQFDPLAVGAEKQLAVSELVLEEEEKFPSLSRRMFHVDLSPLWVWASKIRVD
jgi:hypothetical protein